MTDPAPLFRRQETGLLVGAALWGAGLYVWWRTYSNRGRSPFVVRWVSPF